MLDIEFASKKLQKRFNQEKELLKAFGQKRAKRIRVVMTALRAAPSLGAFAPPYSPPHRCHELTGNRKGLLSVDLDGPYRLIIQPLHNPLPERAEGGLDWNRVTTIKIVGVEDTHG
ncbi:type II toxin-antitoxin system RelE/ParE family toxin [Thiohalomonas denitrificans]|uniref:type II toxin-antitoxin system RelE/ParE family toxin n=1 Tax=Thiohalomonas denitrificans TaxID=415747 RepID=UPI0026E9FC62|nr:killer suppression protein [Thiohalomonas denitrificans]